MWITWGREHELLYPKTPSPLTIKELSELLGWEGLGVGAWSPLTPPPAPTLLADPTSWGTASLSLTMGRTRTAEEAALTWGACGRSWQL